MLSSVYGLESPRIEEAKETIEQSLDLSFSAHDSLYHGGAYLATSKLGRRSSSSGTTISWINHQLNPRLVNFRCLSTLMVTTMHPRWSFACVKYQRHGSRRRTE
jgi:hypothetical protein